MLLACLTAPQDILSDQLWSRRVANNLTGFANLCTDVFEISYYCINNSAANISFTVAISWPPAPPNSWFMVHVPDEQNLLSL